MKLLTQSNHNEEFNNNFTDLDEALFEALSLTDIHDKYYDDIDEKGIYDYYCH